MKHLKDRIVLKKHQDDEEEDDEVETTDNPIVKKEEEQRSNINASPAPQPIMREENLPLRGPRKNRTLPSADSKNIVKNYGKALCAFASSKLARPYIEAVIAKKGYEGVNKQKFMEQMKEKKETTNSMESLRRLLMESSEDSEEDVMFKTIFKEVSIIFMKYISVNWIYSGKLVHKNAHLKFRFKMLRRIKNPEFFTYLKTSAKNSL